MGSPPTPETPSRTTADLPVSLEDALAAVAPVHRLLERAGHRLYLVGGVVRDALVGLPEAERSNDLDATTDAAVDVVLSLVEPIASAVWTAGRRFGTAGFVIDGRTMEITTHRAERYDPKSRKPVVTFGTDLHEDLHRRDFTVNAMAVDVADATLIDPCGGRADLAGRRLRTPLAPEVSFGDDPLRMLRAARFSARFGLEPQPELVAAATAMGDRLAVVSAERIRDELQRLLVTADPRRGLEFLVETGLLRRVVPEASSPTPPGAGQEAQPSGVRQQPTAVTPIGGISSVGPESKLRWAALFAGVSPDAATERLRALRSPVSLITEVAALMTAADAIIASGGRLPEVRRVIRRWDGALDEAVSVARLRAQVRGQATTPVDDFEAAAGDLAQRERPADLHPPLSGQDVMSLLGLSPGPRVGEAINFLSELGLQRGPLTRGEAEQALRNWHADTAEA